jgi:hypothetical protein
VRSPSPFSSNLLLSSPFPSRYDLRRVVKVRLAEKEKENRWMTSEAQSKDNKITEQANEIKELAALVGGNSLDLAKQAEEARRANLLSEEVKYIASLSLF